MDFLNMPHANGILSINTLPGVGGGWDFIAIAESGNEHQQLELPQSPNQALEAQNGDLPLPPPKK